MNASTAAAAAKEACRIIDEATETHHNEVCGALAAALRIVEADMPSVVTALLLTAVTEIKRAHGWAYDEDAEYVLLTILRIKLRGALLVRSGAL